MKNEGADRRERARDGEAAMKPSVAATPVARQTSMRSFAAKPTGSPMTVPKVSVLAPVAASAVREAYEFTGALTPAATTFAPLCPSPRPNVSASACATCGLPTSAGETSANPQRNDLLPILVLPTWAVRSSEVRLSGNS